MLEDIFYWIKINPFIYKKKKTILHYFTLKSAGLNNYLNLEFNNFFEMRIKLIKKRSY